tara:strand:+ start:6349 stop:7326 length:978 start_codon:yes stop_codon:yes gene_type:complete
VANITVHRLLDRPIIDAGTDPSIGTNIQGPSLILAPNWVGKPLGKYYLYFADHKGKSIRLAYADHLEGPWTVYQPGALHLEQTGLPTEPLTIPENWTPSRVLTNFAPSGTPGIPDAVAEVTTPHIASPDVHIDAKNKQVIMYYHGLVDLGVQKTRVAVSSNGIDFTDMGETVGPPYFRTFEHDGMTYALTMPGIMYRSKDGMSDFERGPMLFSLTQRHTAVLKRGDTLYVFWTRVGDAPERIYVSKIDISTEWSDWLVSETRELLRPEREWEGAGLPVEPSYRSAINLPVNQFRDPAVFEENGRTYLLYAVKGEQGIGIAEVSIP